MRAALGECPPALIVTALGVKGIRDLHRRVPFLLSECVGTPQALDRALGEHRGIARLGCAYVPMDEALARVVVDLSGRPYAVVDLAAGRLGALDGDLVVHFLVPLAVHARMALHAQVLYGRSDHH